MGKDLEEFVFVGNVKEQGILVEGDAEGGPDETQKVVQTIQSLCEAVLRLGMTPAWAASSAKERSRRNSFSIEPKIAAVDTFGSNRREKQCQKGAIRATHHQP
jgi:hypothetical protein